MNPSLGTKFTGCSLAATSFPINLMVETMSQISKTGEFVAEERVAKTKHKCSNRLPETSSYLRLVVKEDEQPMRIITTTIMIKACCPCIN